MLLSARILAAAGMATSPLLPGSGGCGDGAVRLRRGVRDRGGGDADRAGLRRGFGIDDGDDFTGDDGAPSALISCTITPALGAGSSRTTLSVSMSIMFSSRETASPTFLCHDSRVASATDSDSWGTLTSICAIL
jgi:hypothetical protein